MPSGKRLEGCRFRLAIQVWIIPLTTRTLLPRHLSVVPRLSVRRRDHWSVEPRLLVCRRLLAIFVACSPSDLLFFVGRGANIVVRWPFFVTVSSASGVSSDTHHCGMYVGRHRPWPSRPC